MSKVTLPFITGAEDQITHEESVQCDICRNLSVPLKEAAKDNPHLFSYLHMLPVSKIGLPEYYHGLSRKMAGNNKPNLIYPLRQAGLFAHVLYDTEEERNHYIAIEPTLTLSGDSLILQADMKLLDLKNKLIRIDSEKDITAQFLDYIGQICSLRENSGGPFTKLLAYLLAKQPFTKIHVTQREQEQLKYLFIRDKTGMGVLEPLMADPYIEDISCSGIGHIFIEHKIFKSLKSTVTFSSLDELDRYVVWLSERVRKTVSYKNPISDATLPDGSRINMVFGGNVSRRGSNFTIRKFSEVPMSVFELAEFGTLDYRILAYLSLVIGNGMNVFVSGETASGKTTLLNAVTTFISPLAKVVTIEDTPELQIPHTNWIREVVQTTKMTDTDGAVTMFDLLRAALRQRPDEILVGEIRGPEGNIAFQAMQTGHSVMATFHAASVEKLIQRITGDPISVPKTYIDNLNVVILTSAVKLPSGNTGRRITSISEVVGYDPFLDSFAFVESFKWNQEKDTFEFPGYMTSYILEERVAPMIGLMRQKRQQIYAEMDRRAKILERLHREQKITGFYEVLDVLAKAQREGLF
jgi:archaeal flagellar protein FlaI